jgi:hypothetical protein
MRTTRLAVVLSGIALGLLTMSSMRAFAQIAGIERHADEVPTWDHERGSILAAMPVLDSPFSGDAVTTWRPTSNTRTHEVRATARYYRDRSGRIRVEQTFVGHAGGLSPSRVIVTPDLNERWGYVLDPVTRTAVRISRSHPSTNAGGALHFVLPLSMSCVITLFRPGLHVPLEEESLGRRTMDGVLVDGTRVTGMLHAELGRGETIDERWFSTELKLEMYARSEDGEIGVVEYRVTTISRAEPPAELFEVPADYVLTAPYRGIVALNPYATETWPRLSPSIKSLCGSATPPGF